MSCKCWSLISYSATSGDDCVQVGFRPVKTETFNLRVQASNPCSGVPLLEQLPGQQTHKWQTSSCTSSSPTKTSFSWRSWVSKNWEWVWEVHRQGWNRSSVERPFHHYRTQATTGHKEGTQRYQRTHWRTAHTLFYTPEILVFDNALFLFISFILLGIFHFCVNNLTSVAPTLRMKKSNWGHYRDNQIPKLFFFYIYI